MRMQIFPPLSRNCNDVSNVLAPGGAVLGKMKLVLLCEIENRSKFTYGGK